MIGLPASMAPIKQRTAEYRMTKDGIARAAQALAPRVAQSFFKQTEYIHSTFDVGRSMFDVHQFLFRLNWPFFGPAAPLIRAFMEKQ
jgi:hypothetical protein